MTHLIRYVRLDLDQLVYKSIQSFDIIYPSEVNGELTHARGENVPDVLFVNTIDARRSAQRETRFGFTLHSDQKEKLKLDTIRLGVYLTMPAYYGEISACKNHSKKFNRKV